MSIAGFIREQVLQPRLAQSGCLVVYDEERRYRGIVQDMASDKLRVVDASESSIESRELAVNGLVALGKGSINGLIVYVPAPAPLTDEAKQADPFSAVGACGDVFPHSDSDSFESICLKAKPEQATAIRQIFAADPHASFAVIDAIGGGQGWPQLRALLGVDSGRDSLLALLVPNPAQEQALKGSDTWSQEARELLKTSIGLTLRTKGKTWSPIAEELWRFVLFSEFAFDLPGPLPAGLADIPCASEAARPIIEGLCENLRSDRRFQPQYIDRAEAIEAELALPEQCQGIKNLGVKDTFPFEERTFLAHAIDAYLKDDIDAVRQILDQHQRSVWTGKGESRAQWDLMRAALELTLRCEDLERQLGSHTKSMESLLDFYASSLRDMDRLHREFEQTLADYEWQDTKGLMSPIKAQARKHYGKLAEKVQLVFSRHIQASGWPTPGGLSNADVFDRIVAPRLQQNGHKVAYFLIDALRYELGVALEKQLAEDGAGRAQACPGAAAQHYARSAWSACCRGQGRP